MGLSLNEGDSFHWNASSWSPALWDWHTDITNTFVQSFLKLVSFVSFSLCAKWLKWLKWNFLFVPHFQTWKASKGQTVLVGACVWAITLPVVHKGSGQSTAWKRYATCDMHITWMILHDHVSQHHSLLWSGDHFPLKNNWIDWSLICSAPPQPSTGEWICLTSHLLIPKMTLSYYNDKTW